MHPRHPGFGNRSIAVMVVLCLGLVGLAIGWVGASSPAPAAPPHPIVSASSASPARAPGLSADSAQVFAAATAMGAAGAMRGVDERAMGLVRGVTVAVSTALPDATAVLTAVDTFLTEQEAEIGAIAVELQRVREGRSKSQRANYEEGLRRRYASEIAAYERALAGFEEQASDTQILELNALMRTLASALGTE